MRVEECATLRAEDVYTLLLKEDVATVQPGESGSVVWTVFGRQFETDWHVRANAVWRNGRVFLSCQGCGARVTRVYVPSALLEAACRRCWGLTYESSALRHYGPAKWLPIPLAAAETILRRERRTGAAEARYAERRRLRGVSNAR